jgi:C4-dicarboxylate transporter DctM subunit
MITILFAAFFILMVIGSPITVCLGLSALITIVFSGSNVPLVVSAQTMFTGVNSYPMLAVPFFILSGNFMGDGGLSEKLIKFVSLFLKRFRGGLANVAIISSMFFAAISGSNAATTAAIGGVMVKEMEKEGYGRGFTAATVAAAGTVGQVIPPSIPMVTYAVIAEVSVGTLFLAGIGPGLLMGVSMLAYSSYYCFKNRIPVVKERLTVSKMIKVLSEAIWALLMPIIILGGIYSGLFTPTEAGAIASVYGLFCGIYVYKSLKWKNVPKILANTAIASSVIMLIMGAVSTFSFVLTKGHIPQIIAENLLSITSNKAVLLFMFNIIVLIAGMFMNASSAIALLTPILLPTLAGAGINPYLLGIVFVVNLGIGSITPPVGNCLYVACNISGIRFEPLVKASVPYMVALAVSLALITYIEPISMWLISK